MHKRKSYVLVILLFNVLIGACTSLPLRQEQLDFTRVDELLQLIDERMAIATLVAQAKWNSGTPIEDPVREKKIFDSAVVQAKKTGIAEDLARNFFLGQFEASKLIQRRLHE